MFVAMRKTQGNYSLSCVDVPLDTTYGVKKARGRAMPVLLLQERTSQATRRASTSLEAHSSSCKEVQHRWGDRPALLQHLDTWANMNFGCKCHFMTVASQTGWIPHSEKQEALTLVCPAPSRIKSSHLTCLSLVPDLVIKMSFLV